MTRVNTDTQPPFDWDTVPVWASPLLTELRRRTRGTIISFSVIPASVGTVHSCGEVTIALKASAFGPRERYFGILYKRDMNNFQMPRLHLALNGVGTYGN